MSDAILTREHVRAMLAAAGITLADDTEYDEVALRLEIAVESLRPLVALDPVPREAQVPVDLPTPDGRRR